MKKDRQSAVFFVPRVEVVVKTWSRINSIDGRLFREDSGKSINFDSHSIELR
jgi:hypothetical protein